MAWLQENVRLYDSMLSKGQDTVNVAMTRRTTGKQSYTPQGQALAALVGESVRLHGRLLAASDRMSRDLGITGARWQVLSVVGSSPQPVTISDAARWMSLARQSVQRIGDALHTDGLVEYLPNPHHQRAQIIQLTAKGRALLARLDRRRYRWANEVAADLAQADLEAAVRQLTTVRQRLGG